MKYIRQLLSVFLIFSLISTSTVFAASDTTVLTNAQAKKSYMIKL